MKGKNSSRRRGEVLGTESPTSRRDTNPPWGQLSEEELNNRINNIKEKLGPNRLNSGVDPTVLWDMTKVGMHYISKGIADFKEWSNVMIHQFGDNIGPYLKEIYARAGEHYTGIKDQPKAPPFYSRAAEIIKEKAPNSATGEQFLNLLKNSSISQDELKYGRVERYLNNNLDTKISKESVLAKIERSGLKLQVVNTTSKDVAIDHPMFISYLHNLWTDGELQSGTGWGMSEKTIRWFSSLPENTTESQMAARIRTAPEEVKADLQVEANNQAEYVTDLDGNTGGSTRYHSYALPGGKNYQETILTLPNEGDYTYKSPHWEGVENPLIHERTTDRVTTDGHDLRLLEELQSDWHQQGRKNGYAPNDVERHTIETAIEDLSDDIEAARSMEDFLDHYDLPTREKELVLEHGTFGRDLYHLEHGLKSYVESYNSGVADSELEHISEANMKKVIHMVHEFKAKEHQDFIQSLENQRHELQKKLNGVLDAPFKKNWHELGFRYALRKAAEDGMGRLGWTTGQQNAERYSLSSRVDHVTYRPDIHGGTVEAFRNGTRLVKQHNVGPKELVDLVGKDVANQLLEQSKNQPEKTDIGSKVKFIANGQVEDGEVVRVMPGDTEPELQIRINDPISGEPHDSSPIYTRVPDQLIHSVVSGKDLDIGGSGMKGFYDKMIPDYAAKFIKKYGGKVGESEFTVPKGEDGSHKYNNGDKVKVHSIDITPEMRKDLLHKGVPIAELEGTHSDVAA